MGDHHVFFGDQIFDSKLTLIAGNLGPAGIPKLLGHFLQLFAHDLHPA